MYSKASFSAVWFAVAAVPLCAQQVAQPTPRTTQNTPQIIQSTTPNPPQIIQLTPPDTAQTNQQRTEAAVESIRPTYVLGSGDQIVIRAFEVEEISDKPTRIDSAGDVDLPILGKVRAAGLTLEQLQVDLAERLKTIVRNPQVVVSVTQFRSEPIFFVGAFKSPGIYPLQGRRTLVEMLTQIGGLAPTASRRIKVTRRLEFGKIPLPTAVEDTEKKVSTVEISIGSLRENVNPAEDIVLQPFDEISVERAEMVYVTGEINHVGALELGERDSISVTQLIVMVGGFTKDAAPDKARVLRPVLNTAKRAEIPLDLKKIMAAKETDFPLQPNDVLYIPRSSSTKAVMDKVALYGLPIVPGLIIYLFTR
jgi:polysaccharide export outer membrane protein